MEREGRKPEQIETSAPAAPTPGKAPLIVQRSAGGAAPSNPAVVQPIAEQGVASGGGPVPFKAEMERGFGTSFDSVSFHSGAGAQSASKAIGADAYTMGNSIAMAQSPTPSLVAHELAHVVQQQAGAGPSSGVGKAGDSFEREADHAASQVASGGTTDLAARYGGFKAGMSGSIQRKAVQRYESGEHAMLGSGPNYPVGNGNLTFPNGATLFSGELVAFGDFYADMQQLGEAPRQELEALAGICRLEAVWFVARRLAAQGHGTSHDAQASLVAGQVAEGSGGNTAGAPPAVAGAAAHSPTGPSATHLQTLPHLDGANPVWSDPNAMVGTTGVSVAMCRQQIFNQFSSVWSAFNIHFDINTQPETGVGILRATIGRRRFRGTNDSLPRPGDPHPWRPNKHEGPAQDPGHLGGDYLDLATNNLSHFTPDNFAHWQDQHQRACSAHASARDDQGRAMALASDNFGCHFLTDRFSTGHFVDKAELMTYATKMMVDTARAPGHVAGASRMSDNDVLKEELKSAVGACFGDPNVMHQWEAGVNEAIENHTVTSGEGRIMRNLPASMVAGMITDVLMESPWRRQGNGPLEPEHGGSFDRARGQGPNSLDPNSARADGNSYQLGVGNLAALQVHDALNAIGFTVENGMGNRWRCQGDDHLQAQTMSIANACVQASQQQVSQNNFNPNAIKAYLPQRAWMDPSWIADYFQGQWANAELDDGRIARLQAMVRGQVIPLNVDGGHQPQTDMMTRICHEIMQILFMPRPAGPTSHEGDHNTGLNISMLKAFLIRRLGDMVSMAYAAASAADIPQQALELYAPRDDAGHTLPRAANNFRWTGGDQVTFDLNVTGCAPSVYPIQIKCFNRDNGYDTEQSGMPGYGLVDSQERGRGAVNTDSEYASFPVFVSVTPPAAGADPSAPRTIQQTITVPRQGGAVSSRVWYDQSDRYIVVTGDAGGQCRIGRSNVMLEGLSNPAPHGHMPRATGTDATTNPNVDPNASPTHDRTPAERVWSPPMRIHNNRFHWEGHAVKFRLEADTPAPQQQDALLNVETFEHNWVASDSLLSMSGVAAHFQQGAMLSDEVTFFPNPPGDTPYVKVLRNGHQIGESARIGHDTGRADRPAQPVVGAQSCSNFVWNGRLLRFQISPEDSTEVYVRFVNSFQASDAAAFMGGYQNPVHEMHRVTVNGGWATADSADIGHNVTAQVFRDSGGREKIGESAPRS
ncbi:MAG TPA: DUF4157 domain-containing protein [Kofleriaceae bacterium]|nr:DUF4157 domain-containing protein [Kofleriaceae bacterium]